MQNNNKNKNFLKNKEDFYLKNGQNLPTKLVVI